MGLWMSGANQHYIPRFLQRAFGIRPRRQWIWLFGADVEPERCRIKKTGSADYFYSEPSADGRPTLDDAITAVEQGMSIRLQTIRSGSPGNPIDAEAAAALVAHLATRTAHLRSTFGDGVARLLEGAKEVFTKPSNVEAMVGVDEDVPNQLVREAIAKELARWPNVERSGLPRSVVERIGFALLKENWGDFGGQFADLAGHLVDELRSLTGEAIRDGHNKAISEAGRSSDLEIAMRSFEWSVESGPPTGAVLPDCVALAFDEEGKTGNHLLVGVSRLQAVVMAVSPDKLLFGRRSGFSIPASFDWNQEAARLSHDFFLSPRNDAETERLRGLIGTGIGPALEESLDGVFDEYTAKDAEALQPGPRAAEGASGWMPTATLNYEVSLTGCGDESTSKRIERLLRALVGAIAKAVPLDRLDGITVSDDYPAALRAVDQGIENAPAVETVSVEIGTGIAHTVTVLRSGVVKGRVVMSNGVCAALIADDRMAVDWGAQVLVGQLARVALILMVDEALPGRLLSSVAEGMTGLLYGVVDGVPQVYVASWTAAVFGDAAETAAGERELLVGSLERLTSTAAVSRSAYRGEDDVRDFLDAVLPEIGNVLAFAASLLGHCASAGSSVFDEAGVLAGALERAGLVRWLDVYRADLERFRRRLGRWESFDEFLAFNRHVERLLWGIGMVLWEEGGAIRFLMAEGDAAFDSGSTR